MRSGIASESEILSILNERPRSADELARMIRQPLSKAAHHIKELLDSDSIEIARVEKARNVAQNFYRTVEFQFYSDEEMAAKTPEERQEFYGLILQASMAEALAAFWAGKITNDPSVWLTWCWFNVDKQGRAEIADEQAESWGRIRDIEARATSRRSESGEDAVSVIVTSFGYERSRTMGTSTLAKGKTGDERQFDWESLVPRVVHPLKVAIIEALTWIDEPLSASDLKRVFSSKFSVGLTSYHLNELVKLGTLEKVGQRRVRGAQEKFYFFAGDGDLARCD